MKYFVVDSTTGKQQSAATEGVAAAYCQYMNSLAGYEKFRVIYG